MPSDVRETIARKVSDRGKRTDGALNLAQTSELQRRAVLASMREYEGFDVEQLELSDAWAEILAGHIDIVYIHSSDLHALRDGDHKTSPLIRLLSASQLSGVSVPEVTPFLVAIRGSKVLEILRVGMRACSHRSLVCTLKHVGPSLRKLHFSCSENDAAKYNPPSLDCPMSLFSANGASNVTSFCPNLEDLSFKCSHIQPSTISVVVKQLPSLETLSLECAEKETIDVSDDDIETLRGLRRVSLRNVVGGLRLASRVGNAVAIVVYHHKVDADAVLQLVNCPRVALVSVHMVGVEGLKNWIKVVPKLKELERLYVELVPSMRFQEIEDAAITAMKILRGLCHSDSAVGLTVAVERSERHAITENMKRISSIVAREGGNVLHTPLECKNQIVCMFRRGTREQCAW